MHPNLNTDTPFKYSEAARAEVLGLFNKYPEGRHKSALFNLAPVGKYVLEFCHTGPCAIEGAERIIEYTKHKLGIGKNQTTPDGMFTIKQVECLGACGYAPMMQVGEFYHEHLTDSKIDQFIEDCRAGKINKGTWKMH
ncbi:MAG: NAD(P)H-dependent oxidoreductase subunit E [Saprospiraceae bacterium]|nr:NAD(P)H-dependent oxidoreductase subunit E [Saprospiraceae bacterium]